MAIACAFVVPYQQFITFMIPMARMDLCPHMSR